MPLAQWEGAGETGRDQGRGLRQRASAGPAWLRGQDKPPVPSASENHRLGRTGSECLPQWSAVLRGDGQTRSGATWFFPVVATFSPLARGLGSDTSVFRLRVMSSGSEPPVTRPGRRDEGPEPPGEGGGQARPSPSPGPSRLGGADGKARTPSPGPRSLGGGGDRARPAPLPEGWCRWAPGPATGCIPAGTLAGLVDSQPGVSEEQLGRPCSFSQRNAAAEGLAVAEGAEAWAGRGCTPWGAAAPP